MGLIAAYPADLDDDVIKTVATSSFDSISHIDKHIFLDGYIRRQYRSISSIPRCLINLIIDYFSISHCIMLYSRNEDTKRGKIDFFDLNQNRLNLQNVLTLKNTVHLNHKMHLNQRSSSFAANIIFKHHNPFKSYHAIFTAKNIVRGGCVDAIIIDPSNEHKVERTLNLPFIGQGQTINHLQYSYSLKSLIAQDSFEGFVNVLPLNDEHHNLEWTRFKDKKHKMKVYGERQYLCDFCFVGNGMSDSRIFVVNYECRGQIFDFEAKQWNNKDLSRFCKDQYRADFGLCFDDWTQRCFISGGCIDAYDYKMSICDNFVHWSHCYDFHKNEWYQLPDTINYHESNPLLWCRDHILYIVSSDIIHERESKRHWNYNDKDIGQQFEMNKIGVIEQYDMRCGEKKNKWMVVPKERQIERIVSWNRDVKDAYIPSKLLNVKL